MLKLLKLISGVFTKITKIGKQLFLINLNINYCFAVIYVIIFVIFTQTNIIMENISLSNSCVNCVNHTENRCSVHEVEVTASNTCETFTNT